MAKRLAERRRLQLRAAESRSAKFAASVFQSDVQKASAMFAARRWKQRAGVA
jgi:hypothetical protein